MMATPVLLRVASLPVERLAPFCASRVVVEYKNAGVEPVAQGRGASLHGSRRSSRAVAGHVVTQASLAISTDIDRYVPAACPASSTDAQPLDRHWVGHAGHNATDYLDRTISFDLKYARAHQTEQDALAMSYGDPILLAGIASASSSLSQGLAKFSAGQGIEPRKQRRMELACLGYLSRACLKPSPFSSFAQVGLGLLVNDTTMPGLVTTPWKQHSLVRIKPYIVDQCVLELSRTAEFIMDCPVEVNNTARCTGENTYACLVPGRWIHRKGGEYAFCADSYVKVRLTNEIWAVLQECALVGTLRYCQVLNYFQDKLQRTRSEVIDLVTRLVESGLLCVRSPWLNNPPVPEHALLGHIQTRQLPSLRNVEHNLHRICSLENECAQNITGEKLLNISQTLELLWASIHSGANAEGGSTYASIGPALKHDSFTVCDGTQIGEIGYVPMSSVTRALSAINPLDVISTLYWPGFDFQHTVAAIIAKMSKGRMEISLVDFLQETQSVWEEFTAYELNARTATPVNDPFNPLAIKEIRKLHELRKQIWQEADLYAIGSDGVDSSLSVEKLCALAHRVPSAYRPTLPRALFLQPTNKAMDSWVLNATADGSGRIESRFVYLMPERTRRAFETLILRRGTWEVNQRRFTLVDLGSAFGDVLNLRPVLAPYVLELPGERFEATADRRLRLDVLRVQLDEESFLPRLMQSCHECLLPVYMGGVAHDFVASSIIRHICMLGPSRQPLLIPKTEGAKSSKVGRVILDNVVLRRAYWAAHRSELPIVTTVGPDSGFFMAINEWRVNAGIPQEVFVRLEVDFDRVAATHKPQYINFGSPMFGRQFASMLRNHGGRIRFEEVLPHWDAFTSQSETHTFELFVDPLLFDRQDHIG